MNNSIEMHIQTKRHGLQIAIIDAIDSDLTELKWNVNHDKYVLRWTPEATLLIHRIIMARVLDRELLRSEFVDHIDTNPLNNMRENLRLATRVQNGQNREMQRNNTSGYKGVSWDKYNRRWMAQIRANGVSMSLGSFKDPLKAARAYNEAALKYHGEFARLNVIPGDESAS